MADYKNYWQWDRAVRVLLAFQKFDDRVYKEVGEEVWHANPMNRLNCEVTDSMYNSLIHILSDGKERDFWKWYERFDTPGGSKGNKPIVWERDGGNYAFLPERLMYALFKQHSRRGFLLAQEAYNKCKQIEEAYEAKTTSPKV